MGWPRLRGGVLSLRVGGGPCPFPCSGALRCPGLCASQGLSGRWHPQPMLGAQGHLLTSQKLFALPVPVLQAGQDGQSEVPALPRHFGACVVVDGSQAAFWQLPPLRAAGCKERSHQRQCEFFRCPQRINVSELSSRLRFFKAEQQICFKFGSRQRRAGGRNFPGIALHFPLKGLCFGAGD